VAEKVRVGQYCGQEAGHVTRRDTRAGSADVVLHEKTRRGNRVGRLAPGNLMAGRLHGQKLLLE